MSGFAQLSLIWVLILHNGNKDYGRRVLNDLFFSSLHSGFRRNLLRVILEHYSEGQADCVCSNKMCD